MRVDRITRTLWLKPCIDHTRRIEWTLWSYSDDEVSGNDPFSGDALKFKSLADNFAQRIGIAKLHLVAKVVSRRPDSAG